MTFDHAIGRLEGYAMRVAEQDGEQTAIAMRGLVLDAIKAHEGTACSPVTYDVASNERHKAACELRDWKPRMVIRYPGESETYIKVLCQMLTGRVGSDVTAQEAATAVRDKLVELLKS